MAGTLLIVESPAKARTLQKYLGKEFVVKASMGHVRDLPSNKLSVDIEKQFAPTFVVPPEKKKVVTELSRAARKTDTVLLGADPDREGEAICYHLAEVLRGSDKPVGRVLFHEITPDAIRSAVETPSEIDSHKVSAQIARRVIDRLVGYQVSPLLWEKVKKGLSAGRVQTVALRMVCEREAEIKAFKPEEYWNVSADLQGKAERPFSAKLTKIKGKKARIASAAENEALRSSLEGRNWAVESIEKKKQKRSPAAPFTTSKLQQEAARLLKFPVKRTMGVAQRLYEGVDIAGGETVGLITYMRTDSTRLIPQAVESARGFIEEKYGKEYLPSKSRLYAPKKAAQDAHEAIRPTDVRRTPDEVKPFLQKDEFNLYRLIWRRFVACQMADALFDNTKAQIGCADAVFTATGTICTFRGFRAVYETEEDPDKGTLPPIEKGEALNLIKLNSEQKFTEPPPRYTEASLVKALEENGIGRPSTYAAIISTIQDRDYVDKVKASLIPTDLGLLVSELLVKHFPALFDLSYTATMEEQLDKVEKGEEERLGLLARFYESFERELSSAKESMVDLRKEGQATDEVCEKCGKPMVLKMGRYGRFLACSGYPECKSTKPVAEESLPEVPEGAETCPACGGKMAVRPGRYGPFLACEKYPECKTTMNLKRGQDGTFVVQKDEMLDETCPECGANLMKKHGRYGPFTACSKYPECKYIKRDIIDMPCPKCGKEIARRISKRKKVFYGCTGYPKCDFVAWYPPVKGKCPDCGSPYLVERKTRDGSVKICCPEKGCKYTQ